VSRLGVSLGLVIAKPGLSPKRLTLEIGSRLNQQTPILGLVIDKPGLSPNGTYVRQILYESLTTSRQATVFGGAKRRRLPANR